MVEARILSNERTHTKKWIDFSYGRDLSIHEHDEPITFTKGEQNQIKEFVEKMDHFSQRGARPRRLRKTVQVKKVDVAARKAILRNGRHLFRILKRVEDVRASTFEDLFGDEPQLTLTLDAQTRKFPWELAHDGNRFLCQSYDVGRKVLTADYQRQSGVRPQYRTALVIGLNYSWVKGKGYRLKKAEREALQVAKQIESRYYNVALLRGQEATVKNVKRILSEGVSVFHFTGHGGYMEDQPTGKQGSLQLSDGELTEEDLKACFEKAKGAPFFSFLNACESAKEIYSSPMIDAFVELGAECVMGTFWSIYDEPSEKFSLRLYGEVAKGTTFAHALRLARWRSSGKRSYESATWPSFVFYGSPNAWLPTAPQ